ncbi:hypothetical protein [Synechococcus sp. CCY 9618]|uniref:hypothetical protein n=1 Tax=Synechococcus sp. CCY 9618 TaxID=2815602 RepID=UPI001C21C586|nr:hypothetical protein [Synechococcus sp. CCY 9618]
MKRLLSLFSSEPVDLRTFLWLCAPALLVGFALRSHFLWVTPQGYFGADSGSYYEFAHQLFTKGEFDLSPKRRWLYPIFLALVTAIPAPCWYVLPLLQHLIGLATIVGIGWIARYLSLRPRFSVPLVTLICAVWPRMLWYEHEFIAETLLLAAFVFTVAVALTPGVFTSRQGLFLLTIATILLAGMKGAGRFLWLGAIIGFVIHAGDPRRWAWTWRSGLAGLTALLLAITVGKSSQGYWLLLNSVLPMVRESGEPHRRYREALRPVVLEARAAGNSYPWVAQNFKKRFNSKDSSAIHPIWAELNKDELRFSQVARSLSMDAIRDHPLKFLQFTVTTTGIAMSGSLVNHRFDPPEFWREQLLNTRNRWIKKPSYFSLPFRVDAGEFQRLARAGDLRNYRFTGFLHAVDKHFRWVEPAGPAGAHESGLASLRLRPFGILMVLGVLISLRPSLLRRAALLLLPAGLYILGVFAVGDAVSRYLHPVEWVGILLAILALEILLRLLMHALGRLWRAVGAGPPAHETPP